jgi:hypothetical protein
MIARKRTKMRTYFAGLFYILIFQTIPEEAHILISEKKRKNHGQIGCTVVGFSQNSEAVTNSRLVEGLQPNI